MFQKVRRNFLRIIASVLVTIYEWCMMHRMKFASTLSTNSNSAAAAEELLKSFDELAEQPHLAFLFVSPHHITNIAELHRPIVDRLGDGVLLGCSGESIVGRGQEVEGEPAASLWVAHLPDVKLQPLFLNFERTPEGGVIVGWPEELEGDWPENAALLMTADPFSFPADSLLERLNEDRPGVPVIGGMASASQTPGGNVLFFNDKIETEGATAVLVSGNVRVRPLVSQGCRPIGHHLVVTQAEQNVIGQLGGQPALLQLKAIFDELSTTEQRLVQQGLHVGRAVNAYQDSFEQGDFLIRNVVGIDSEKGTITVGDFFRLGQTVQFNIRDDRTADAELRELLASARKGSPAGALLFTCNGRGTRLFPEPHHDAQCVSETLGDIPLAGFFAMGELGPIAGSNFMHGFTASLALFEEA